MDNKTVKPPPTRSWTDASGTKFTRSSSGVITSQTLAEQRASLQTRLDKIQGEIDALPALPKEEKING